VPEYNRVDNNSRNNQAQAPSVLVVDNYVLVRSGVKQVLGEEYRGVVFGEARSAGEAANYLARQPWDLVVIGLGLPDREGFQVLQDTLSRRPGSRVVVLCINADRVYAARVRQLGAFGYIPMNADRSDLVKTFRNVLAGRKHFVRCEQADEKAANPDVESHLLLSRREYKVMLAIAAGKNNRDIGAELKISITTVSTYKRRILDKMHLVSTADLIRYVMVNNLPLDI
jgi:DNA-binding NarL/FixJ family response regulator